MACQICGEKSGYLPLCKPCFKLRDEDKVIKCECGKWRRTDDKCECQVAEDVKYNEGDRITTPDYGDGTVIEVSDTHLTIKFDAEKSNRCWAIYSTVLYNGVEKLGESVDVSKMQKPIENSCSKCSRPSGNHDVCYDCYRRQMEDKLRQDNESLIESEKDSGIDVRKKWPLKIRTQSGTYVRSHAECRIADWLYNNSISFSYEQMVVSKHDRNKFLLSDFYIPQANLFLEYWGYKDRETYTKRRNEKKAIYDEKELKMEDLEDHHLEVLDDCLRQILSPYFSHL